MYFQPHLDTHTDLEPKRTLDRNIAHKWQPMADELYKLLFDLLEINYVAIERNPRLMNYPNHYKEKKN